VSTTIVKLKLLPASKRHIIIIIIIIITAGRCHLSAMAVRDRALTWDVTVATTLADSYLPAFTVTAASQKEVKYSDLPASFSFQPIAVETLGPISESAVDFLRELGRRISSKFQEERQSAYLFQRLSVTVQRFNAVILHDSFPPSSDLWPPME